MLRRIRHSGGTEIRSEGLYYNAPLCGGQLATGCGDVGGACRGNKHLLCRYLRMMRTPDNIFTGAYYYLLVTFIGVPCTFFYNLLSSIYVLWVIARRRSGFCSFHRPEYSA